MKFYIGLSLFLCSCLTVSIARAQDTTAYINSKEVINQAIALHDSSDYEGAMNLYQLVTPSDTNYAWSVSERMLTLNALERYDAAIELGKTNIQKPSDYRASIYSNMATALDYSGQTKEALTVLESALEKYPYHTRLIYNYGVTLRRDGQNKLAQEMFMRRLKLTPFHSSSHYQLAELSMLQGFRAKAMMSYLFYLVIRPSDRTTLSKVEDLLIDKIDEENSLAPFNSNGFEDLDGLIRAKLATSESYKPSVPLNYRIARHAEVIIKQLQEASNSGDFWNEFYVPFYKMVSNEKHLPAFIYTMLSGVNKEDLQSWIGENRNKISELGTSANDFVEKFKSVGIATVLDQNASYQFWYFDNGALNVIGRSDPEGKDIGPHHFFYSNGETQTLGSYNNAGQKIGLWKYFNTDGTLSSTEEYNDQGQLNGSSINYYPSGTVRSEVIYENGIANSQIKLYYECGPMEETYMAVNNQIQGDGSTYYPSGQVRMEYKMENSVISGPVTEYYESGHIASRYGYKDGKRHGPFESYHKNGQVSEKGEYMDGQLHGKWLGYYENGLQRYEYNYSQGTQVEIGKSYSKRGVLMEEYELDTAGEYNGEYKSYDHDGKLHMISDYEHGRMVGYKNYDKAGQVIAQGSGKDSLHLQAFSPLGQKWQDAYYVDGKLNGPLTFYHSNGKINYRVGTKDGEWHGMYEEFYETGELKTKTTYTEGTNDGWHWEYYRNGQISTEGMVVNGNLEQWLFYYYPDGNLKQKVYYSAGNLAGQSILYGPEGKIYSEQVYRGGVEQSFKQFNKKGNVLSSSDTPNGSGKLEAKMPNGELRLAQTLSCGRLEDSSTFYYGADQLDAQYNLVHDEYTGLTRSYYLTGKVRSEGFMKNSLSDSTWVWYDLNGDVSSKGIYVEDQAQGVSTDYYPNGQIDSQCNYLDDERHGSCEYFDSSGALRVKKTYAYIAGIQNFQYLLPSGELSEPKDIPLDQEVKVVAFYQNGQKSLEQSYNLGLLDGKSTYYHPNGKIASVTDYNIGDIHGWERTYYDNGQLKSEEYYEYDRENGTSKYYYRDGTLQRTVEYLHGIKNGMEIWYTPEGKVSHQSFFWNNMAFN